MGPIAGLAAAVPTTPYCLPDPAYCMAIGHFCDCLPWANLGLRARLHAVCILWVNLSMLPPRPSMLLNLDP